MGDSVGSAGGATVGTEVGDSVGAAGDGPVGVAVGEAVGTEVGDSVGAAGGDAVGTKVGGSVGTAGDTSVLVPLHVICPPSRPMPHLEERGAALQLERRGLSCHSCGIEDPVIKPGCS